MLILMVGLPGTGKSTLCRALADRFGGFVIDKDVIRPALFGPSQIEYTVEQDDFCQNLMELTAEYLLRRRPELRVFVDGRPFSREYQRENVRKTAERIGTPFTVIECAAPEETALARIRKDLESGTHPAANRTEQLYFEKKRDFDREPLKGPRLCVSSDQELEKSVIEADAYIDRIAKRFVPSSQR